MEGKELLKEMLDKKLFSIEDVISVASDYMYEVDETEYAAEKDIPEYVVASTLFDERETYVFHADANGDILDFTELARIAYRFGDFDWNNHKKVVCEVSEDYQFVKTVHNDSKKIQHLYKR